ncbi:MAG TPA: hypothetical protein VE890_17865 [Thermoguttaceae bacterium]|nr:hypothetical protein [Thermoguttaceae bacterium]
MSKPDFTPEEQYLISSAKTAAGAGLLFDLAYLLPSVLLAGFGVYTDEIGVVVVAFAVLVGFKVFERSHARKWDPVWKRIFQKYDEAIEGKD